LSGNVQMGPAGVARTPVIPLCYGLLPSFTLKMTPPGSDDVDPKSVGKSVGTRSLHRLSAVGVQKAAKPGMYADGGGLYLQVRGPMSKSWIFRYKLSGRAREMGLGPLAVVSLARARELATEARKQCFDGVDPIELKRSQQAEREAEQEKARVPTFDEATTAYLHSNSAGWKNSKHAQQWSSTLATYASPHFGNCPVDRIDLKAVLKALQPIWATKTETAGRVRGRIEAVLDWATVLGHRTGDNPARWRGNLDKVLPMQRRVSTVKHHAALPYDAAPAFIRELAERTETAARALLFTVLTASRTSEVLGMRWSEIDLDKALWTVPALRMKAGREHRVPLAEPVIDILQKLSRGEPTDLVFPGPGDDRQLSINAMPAVLKRMKLVDVTVHGFRSSFRDWAAERTDAANEVVEAALAHTIGNKVEAAYRRGDLLDKRRALMNNWAVYLATPD
jgi:integrase